MQISEHTVRLYPPTPEGERLANIYETQTRRIGTFRDRKESTASIQIETLTTITIQEDNND